MRFIAIAASFGAIFGHPDCAHALVLCVGDDGHVEIESSMRGACAEGDAHAERGPAQGPEEMQARDAGEHCGECTDVPLVHGTFDLSTVRGSVRLAAPPAALPVQFLSLVPAVMLDGAPAHRPIAVPAYLPPLRSVLLRI